MSVLTARSWAAAPPGPRYRATYRQQLVTVALGTWLMVGLFVDGWAHNTLDASLETFFTPWHALFYSGFSACACWLVWLVRGGLRSGRTGAAAVPAGYGLGLVGLAVFAAGGAGDMTWHLVFGIERDIEALFSPTHLVLFAGAALVLTSPFRDAWAADGPAAPTLRAFLPPLASLTLLVSLLAFFFMYWSPVTAWSPVLGAARWADDAGEYADTLRSFMLTEGVVTVLLMSVLLVGPLLLMLRRWQVPVGTVTVLTTVPAVLSGALNAFDQPVLVVAALLAGLVGDGLVRALRPDPQRLGAVRLVAALAPMAAASSWFGALSLTRGVWYPLEVWSGTVVWAGLAGLGLALLMLPAPAGRAEPAPADPGAARTDVPTPRTP